MTELVTWSESGGVGKTTTAINLGAALGRRGDDVLLVDLDPQPASLTAAAGHAEAKTTDGTTITDVLLDDGDLRELVIEDEPFDLVPGHESLASLESTARAEGISTAEFLLRSSLAPVADEYDHVIIDPPATLNLLVDNALIATGNVLVPMEMTRKGEQSIGGVLDTVEALESQLQRAQPDFALEVIGVLPNKVEGSSLNQQVRETLAAEADGVRVLPVTVPDYNVLAQAWDEGLDIFRYADAHGLRAYQESLLEAYEDLAEIVAAHGTDERQAVVND
ncbi:ParA family protein [Haloglomus halophilum]|uniref:ParA family protein n=1 Tax=Haloglomus halophilum TaxID=2962672 RepID=UPI0020C97406|nr:ParA family protein [Haloglomus halophilum]